MGWTGQTTSESGEEPAKSRGGEDAFISYRRADATLVAHWLRYRLRHFRFPPELRGRGYRSPDCFVDEFFRRSTSDFFDHWLEPRLRTTPFLILVMSPKVMEPLPTGEKNWVQKELEEFLKHQTKDRVLIVLARGHFTQPLPAALADRSDIADLRGVRFWRRLLPPRPPSPRSEVIPIIARMCSVRDDDLPLLYREERRRKWRLAVRSSLVGLTIIVLLSLLSFWALTEAKNARAALVRAHLSRARDALETDSAASQFALLQALQAASGRWPILRPALDDGIVRFWLAWWRNRPEPMVSWHHDMAYSVLIRGHHGISGGADGVVFSVSLTKDQVHEIGRLPGGPVHLVGGTGTSFAAFEHHGPLVLLWASPDSAPVSIGLQPEGRSSWVAMHPQRIETAIAGEDGSIRIFDETGDLMSRFVLDEPLDWVGYGAKGEFLVARCVSTDGHPQHFFFLGIRGGSSALQLGERGLFEMGSPEFSADRTLLAVPEGNGVRILDAIRQTKGALLKHGAPPSTARFNRDGSLLLTTSIDRTAIVWNTKTWTAASPAMLHPAPVLGGVFLADDRWVLTSDYTAMVRLWDRLQPVVAGVPWKLGDWANQLTVDRSWVGVAGVDGSARFFEIEPPAPRLSEVEPSAVWRTQLPNVILVRKGDQVHVVNSEGRSVRAWAAQGRKVYVDENGTSLLAEDKGGRLWIVDLSVDPPQERERRPVSPEELPRIDQDRSVLLQSALDVSGEGEISFDLKVGTVFPFPVERDEPFFAARSGLSPSGELLWAEESGSVRMWGVRDGSLRFRVSPEGDGRFLAFSSDESQWLTTAGPDVAQVRSTSDGKVVSPLLPHERPVAAGAFLIGDRVVVTAMEKRLLFWEARTGERIGLPLSHESRILGLCPFADQRHLAVSLADGRLAIWDLSPETGQIEDLWSGAERQTLFRVGDHGGLVLVHRSTAEAVRRPGG